MCKREEVRRKGLGGPSGWFWGRDGGSAVLQWCRGPSMGAAGVGSWYIGNRLGRQGKLGVATDSWTAVPPLLRRRACAAC